MKFAWSRVSQLLFLIIFFVLFVNTEYRGKDEISAAINSFFRADPLVVISYLLSQKAFSLLLLPGALMAGFSLILGRFFCGWICPLGTIIDLVTKYIPKKAPLRFLKSRFKYYLLFCLLFAALFNVNLAGILDPIAILVRAMTFFFYPLFGYSIRSSWAGLYGLIGENRDYVGFIFNFFRDFVLPFQGNFLSPCLSFPSPLCRHYLFGTLRAEKLVQESLPPGNPTRPSWEVLHLQASPFKALCRL